MHCNRAFDQHLFGKNRIKVGVRVFFWPLLEKIRTIQETLRLKMAQKLRNMQAGQKNWFLIKKK